MDGVQNEVLVHLSGDDSVIGRSILLYDQTVDEKDRLVHPDALACCVIGKDERSTLSINKGNISPADMPYKPPHHSHHQSHGHPHHKGSSNHQ